MKVLIHLVPRCGDDSELAFEQHFGELCDELRGAALAGMRVNAMRRIDMERAAIGPDTPYRAALELLGDGDAESFAPLLEGLGERIEPWCLADASTLLLGTDHAFRPSEQAPIRYQYLMRRNGHFSREHYLARYRDIHSRFGIECPGIVGYVQFHVDAEGLAPVGGARRPRPVGCGQRLRAAHRFTGSVLRRGDGVGDRSRGDGR